MVATFIYERNVHLNIVNIIVSFFFILICAREYHININLHLKYNLSQHIFFSSFNIFVHPVSDYFIHILTLINIFLFFRHQENYYYYVNISIESFLAIVRA
jgi:hypothetical protein